MPGTARPRGGKPYLYVTWLAKLLGGQQCEWRVWFQSRFKHRKVEEQSFDLVEWNRQHNAFMAARRRELEAEGATVTTEGQNAFKVEGAAAVVAGKPDLIATWPDRALLVDGKTGRQRDADVHQVLLYLYAVPKARPELVLRRMLEGEVHYQRGDERITLTPAELTEGWLRNLVELIRRVTAAEPARKVPSRDECRRCNIGREDCPERVTSDPVPARVGAW